MEPTPNNPNFSRSDYERFAVELFDQADKYFAHIHADSYYEKINDRYMAAELSTDDLDRVEPLLAKYMIDPADAIDLVLLGGNPRTSSAQRGVFWLNLRQGDLVSSYAVWINDTLPQPITATKDMYKVSSVGLTKGEPYDTDEAATIDEVIFSGTAIGIDEQNALREILEEMSGI